MNGHLVSLSNLSLRFNKIKSVMPNIANLKVSVDESIVYICSSVCVSLWLLLLECPVSCRFRV